MLGLERTWYTSDLGAHFTSTLLFGLLIMLAVFNRFNPAYEEAARDLGASGLQTVNHVVLPIVLPSLVGVALFGFTPDLRRARLHVPGHRRLEHATP